MIKNSYKILTSACLLGEKVRYDAQVKECSDPLLTLWLAQGILLPICPEVLGGLPTPRPAAEIQINQLIKTKQGDDVTAAFLAGAQRTLAMALKHNIKIAILTERSPSCASSQIYDGHFARHLIAGQGVTTQLLRENGITVFNQFQLKEVALKLQSI